MALGRGPAVAGRADLPRKVSPVRLSPWQASNRMAVLEQRHEP